MRVLIVEGAASRGCLAAARSLARSGVEVGVGHIPGHSLAASSKAVRHKVCLPSPQAGLAEYVRAVNRAVGQHGYDQVLGAGDAEVMALTARREDIPAVVPHPERSVLMTATDKLVLHEAASVAGLASPDTDEDPLGPTVAAWLRDGAVVVKPRLHWDPHRPAAPLRVDAGLARTPDDLRRLTDAITSGGGKAIAQRFIRGSLVAYVSVRDRSGCVAHAQQRAVHTWPEPVGVAARALTVPVDPDIAAATDRLLRSLGIDGLVQLQFLVDDSGRHHVIDLNARYYGSMQLAISAGVDLPRIWAELTAGSRQARTGVAEGRPGVHYQWLEGDLRRSAALKDPGGVVGALLHATRAHHSIWSPRDPRPGLAHVAELARRARRQVGSP